MNDFRRVIVAVKKPFGTAIGLRNSGESRAYGSPSNGVTGQRFRSGRGQVAASQVSVLYLVVLDQIDPDPSIGLHSRCFD